MPALLLSMFRQLYDIEDRAKAFVPDDRLALRHAESRPIWERMREYRASEATMNVMPKELFGQAMTSLRNQFEHLLVYLDDGLMPIDNNETEQLMKQVALGRKNWMFIGSVAAGCRAADLMSLVSSAHRNDLDIFVYVKDVLDRLLAGETNYDDLRPEPGQPLFAIRGPARSDAAAYSSRYGRGNRECRGNPIHARGNLFFGWARKSGRILGKPG